jgi:hypothetical protein
VSERQDKRRARQDAREARRKAREGRPIGWRAGRWTLAIAIAVSVAAIRWMTAAHLHIGQWATGVPVTPGTYIFIIIVIALLIAPEASSISFGGLKVMLRENKAEIEKVDERVHQLQLQVTASANAAARADIDIRLVLPASVVADLAAENKQAATAPAVPAEEVGRYIGRAGGAGRVMTSTGQGTRSSV